VLDGSFLSLKFGFILVWTQPGVSFEYLSIKVCADRIGTERGCTFIGNSCITDPAGGFVAGPASPDEPQIIAADINIMQSRFRHWSEFNNPLTDRRKDLYDPYFGYDPATGKIKV
jgi:predicted amidohydrolase